MYQRTFIQSAGLVASVANVAALMPDRVWIPVVGVEGASVWARVPVSASGRFTERASMGIGQATARRARTREIERDGAEATASGAGVRNA